MVKGMKNINIIIDGISKSSGYNRIDTIASDHGIVFKTRRNENNGVLISKELKPITLHTTKQRKTVQAFDWFEIYGRPSSIKVNTLKMASELAQRITHIDGEAVEWAIVGIYGAGRHMFSYLYKFGTVSGREFYYIERYNDSEWFELVS